MPAALTYNLAHDHYNWFYHTEPQEHMNNRKMYWPRGRVWGGSSSLNAMAYVRGHPLDYDRWEKEGATGWSYANCLPYFKKAQTHEFGGDAYRGGDGPLHVSRGKTNHPLHAAWLEAGQQAGYPLTEDMNGYMQEGVGMMDMTVHKGVRWSTASAYLRPVLKRPNLETLVKAMVNRVLFDGKRAVGVEVVDGKGETRRVMANREVILCGGAVNSPQLLMLSGVGDGDHLRSFGLPVVQHLPGVGQNLQDHLEIYVQQECTQPITLYSAQWKYPHKMIAIGLEWFIKQTGWGASSHLESGGFIRSEPGVPHPDIQFHFLPSTVQDHGRRMGPCHAYQVHVGPMRPTSVGSLLLRSADPRAPPRLQPNYLATERDRWEMRAAVRLSREILGQPAFAPFRGPELSPGSSCTSDADLDAFVRAKADSAYHPSCTCAMGTGPRAVVDPECRVLGTEALRVVDASVMPSVPSGNLNAPVVMIAEKAADVILGREPLPPARVPVWSPKDLMSQREVSP